MWSVFNIRDLEMKIEVKKEVKKEVKIDRSKLVKVKGPEYTAVCI